MRYHRSSVCRRCLHTDRAILIILIILTVLIIGALYLLIRVLMALACTVEAASAKRKAWAAEPAVPAARIVKDYLKASDPRS